MEVVGLSWHLAVRATAPLCGVSEAEAQSRTTRLTLLTASRDSSKPRLRPNSRAILVHPARKRQHRSKKTQRTYEFPTFCSLIGVRAVGEPFRSFRWTCKGLVIIASASRATRDFFTHMTARRSLQAGNGDGRRKDGCNAAAGEGKN